MKSGFQFFVGFHCQYHFASKELDCLKLEEVFAFGFGSFESSNQPLDSGTVEMATNVEIAESAQDKQNASQSENSEDLITDAPKDFSSFLVLTSILAISENWSSNFLDHTTYFSSNFSFSKVKQPETLEATCP